MTVTEQQEAPAKSGPSLIIQIAVLLVLTAAAVGMGWFSGFYLNSSGADVPQKAEPTRIDKAHVKTTDKTATRKDGQPAATGGEPGVLPIEAITTNLAAPSNVWVRMELSLVFDGDPDTAVAEQIHQDFLAFMRTVKLPQVEGASGFQHLKEDLEERARLRSHGRVTNILIRTLLFE
ncbi:MAG: flagellar basal body-associated FliL family protein [Hyphomicrobiales bacterium]|nr:flagellar basal body-associated FliL family protein [Hyphomicrobiales bacterium]